MSIYVEKHLRWLALSVLKQPGLEMRIEQLLSLGRIKDLCPLPNTAEKHK